MLLLVHWCFVHLTMCLLSTFFLLVKYSFIFFFFFFFKQKTAYEMRISDWSSDVCSSDLAVHHRRGRDAEAHRMIHRQREFVHRRNALFGVDEQPFPVERYDLDVDRLCFGRNRLSGRGARERAIGVEQVRRNPGRSEEHTSELQSLMRISYAVFCLKK